MSAAIPPRRASLMTLSLLMEPTLDRPPVGRFRMRLPLALVLGFVLVAFMPLAAGESGHIVDASMHVSKSEASPGDNVTFWISIDPLAEDARDLVITETLPTGLAVASTSAPASCSERNGTWLCSMDDRRPFAIEVRVVVNPGTEGQDLVNVVRVETRADGEGRYAVTLRAGVHVVPASPIKEPDLHVRVSASQTAVVPGSVLNYRIELTNNGTAAASDVSVVVSMPAAMVLVSASPWPSSSEGQLKWTLTSLPVSSFDFLFNTTLPVANGLTQVQVAVTVTYGDGHGKEVRIESLPSSLSVVPVVSASASPGLPIGLIAVVVAFVGGGLIVVQRTVGLPLLGRSGAEEIFLLHRSGLVLKHFSAHPSPEADSDIVGGMMAAVRMFVEDSVSPSAGPLREIRFGGGNIVFVNGNNVTLAAVNTKGNRVQFADRAKRFLRGFERMNGDALMNFDGVAGRLTGVDTVVQKFGRAPKTFAPLIGRAAAGDVPRQ